ncbi:MAG: hypothetical protein AB7U48_02995 [Bauldia sp.]
MVIWATTPGLPRFAMPGPLGRNDRFAGIIRGMVKSREDAERTLAMWMQQSINAARSRGLLGREFYFRLPAPDRRRRWNSSASTTGSTPRACRPTMPIPP